MNHCAPKLTIGIDLGDHTSHFCIMDHEGITVEEGKAPSTREALTTNFSHRGRARIVMEAGSQSPWVYRLLTDLGHEVLVANPGKLALISKSNHKSDRCDAQMLAQVGRADCGLLSPIHPRSEKAQIHRSTLRARDVAVSTRTKIISCVRGLAKVFGCRMRKCATPTFLEKACGELPSELKRELKPLLRVLSAATRSIREYDRQIEALANHEYKETASLRQVDGVGALTATAFILAIGDPARFQKSRDVAAFLGLTPRQKQSGGCNPHAHITKAGDKMVRKLLVQSARHILGRCGADCDLKRWGRALAERGGKDAKNRATVAVARKLSVVLHHLWRSGELYRPLRSAVESSQAAPA